MSQSCKVIKCLMGLCAVLVALGKEIAESIAAFAAIINTTGVGIVEGGFNDGYEDEAADLGAKLIATLENAQSIAEKACDGLRACRHAAQKAIAESPVKEG